MNEEELAELAWHSVDMWENYTQTRLQVNEELHKLHPDLTQPQLDRLRKKIGESYINSTNGDKYLLVKSHFEEDYFVENKHTQAQIDQIEETCMRCGDYDRVIGSFSTLEEAKKIIKEQPYGTDYAEGLIKNVELLLSKPE